MCKIRYLLIYNFIETGIIRGNYMKNTACSGNGYKTAQKTERSLFTRMCIGEAIIELMQDKGMNGVNVSAIAKRSGVSRMTFYYYYDSVQEALTDYMKEIVADYLKARKNTPGLGNYQEYSHVVFSLICLFCREKQGEDMYKKQIYKRNMRINS